LVLSLPKKSSHRKRAEMRLRSTQPRRTLVLIPEIGDDLVKVVQGKGLEDVSLALLVACDVAASGRPYPVSFFMESMSIFFSSLCPIIRTNYNYKRYYQPMHDPDPHRLTDLSLDNIELAHPNRHDSKSVLQENKFIRKQNEVLRR
jgi:hypothetical protein